MSVAQRVSALCLWVVLFSLVTSCGHSDDNEDEALPRPRTGTLPGPQADPGCTDEHPHARRIDDGWVRSVITYCAGASGRVARISNISPLMLTVQPGVQTTLATPLMAGEDSFESATYASLANGWSGGAVLLPPGGSVDASIGTGTGPSVFVGAETGHVMRSWAAAKLADYVQNRLTTPDQRLADGAAACAREAGASLESVGVGVDLDLALADLLLGAAPTCASLMNEVSAQTDEATPPRSVLQQEFKRLGGYFKGALADDVLAWGRAAVRVLLS